MNTRITLLAFSSLFLIGLAGCNGRVELFQVEMHSAPDGSAARAAAAAVRMALREEPAAKPEAEGYLSPTTGSTPVYTLESAVVVPDGGMDWVFSVQDARLPLTVTVRGANGEEVAVRRVASAPEDLLRAVPVAHNVVVPLPEGAEVGGFEVSGQIASPDAEPRARLVAVESWPAGDPSRVGLSMSDHGLVWGTGVVDAMWRPVDGPAALWGVRTDPSFWPSLVPVDIQYHYTPHRGETLHDPSGQRVPAAEVRVGEVTLRLAVRPGVGRVVVYPELYGAAATEVSVSFSMPDFSVTRIGPLLTHESDLSAVSTGDGLPGAAETPAPLPADLGTVFEYPRSLWRAAEFELFSWSLFPDVLVMDTADYEIQSRFFKRLAFFTEKEGYRGRILTDAEMTGRHGYNAHNYSAAGLAAFFTAAGASGVALTAEELLLRRIATAEGLIVPSTEGYLAGGGGILSISQQSNGIAGLRKLLLTHEAYHGVYYGSAEYAAQVRELWANISEDEQRFWTLFLDGMQYDVTDPMLVVNEFHAYLLQQPLDSVTWYFEGRSAERLRSWKPNEAVWIDRFLAANRGIFRHRALEVNSLLFDLTGLTGGEVFCLSQ